MNSLLDTFRQARARSRASKNPLAIEGEAQPGWGSSGQRNYLLHTDMLHSAPPSRLVEIPSAGAFIAAYEEAITQMVAQGAVDEGSGAVLDRKIEAEIAQFHQRLSQHTDDRVRSINALERPEFRVSATDTQEALWAAHRLRQAQRHLAQVRAAILGEPAPEEASEIPDQLQVPVPVAVPAPGEAITSRGSGQQHLTAPGQVPEPGLVQAVEPAPGQDTAAPATGQEHRRMGGVEPLPRHGADEQDPAAEAV
ncbi:hypothetical protein QYM41_16345 [Kocuria sp. CPCC 205268]|uniref:hypothetical protein n=1 Tax=Kocuria oxytropis TaxID=3058913 RepID=UPI0034D71B3F